MTYLSKENELRQKALAEAAKKGKEVAAKFAASNPLIKELVKRFDLRLDLPKIADYGTKIKEDELRDKH
jgi:hypothetical protein